MVALTPDHIDESVVLASVRNQSCGAVASFTGVVRADEEHGDRVVALEYEAHPTMALQALEGVGEVLQPFGNLRWSVVHRTGRVPAGEVSVVVAVAAPHREAAFAACRAAVERLKSSVPIWKRVHFASGRAEWAEGTPLTQ